VNNFVIDEHGTIEGRRGSKESPSVSKVEAIIWPWNTGPHNPKYRIFGNCK
jgi:hypothetical protein